MIVVKNNLKKVLVLKALGHPVLRFLPGFNEVDAKDLSAYTKDNPAAEAMCEDHISLVSRKLKSAEQAEAAASKAKNDKLNASAKVLKQTQEKLAEAEAKGKSSSKEVDSLKAEMVSLKESLATALSAIDDMKADKVLDAARKEVDAAQSTLDAATTDAAKKKAAKALDEATAALENLEDGK